MGWYCNYTGRGSNGPSGVSGNSVAESSVLGSNGDVGIEKLTTIEPNIQLKGFSFTFFKMLIHEAELDYLNKKLSDAISKLIWLEGILSQESILANEAVDILLENRDTTQNDVYIKVLLEKVQALLIQISQGLDFYGNYPNYIPLTSIKIYESSIEQMINLSKDVEVAYNKYYSNEQSDIIKRGAINEAIDSIESQRDSLVLNKQQLVTEVNQGKEQIADMLEEIVLLEIKIREAKEEFENAVSNEAACGLSDVIKAGAAIATIASGFGALAGGAAMLAETSNYIQKQDVKKRFKKGADYITEHATTVKNGFEGIASGYQSIKGILETERDGAKLIAAEEDFEAAVKKFEHLPEAREYRRLMRQFLALTKNRNNKILEIDAKTTRIFEMEIESDELNIDIQSTRSRLLEVFNPKLSEHVLFFERALSRTKAALLRAIVMEHKALEYWGLTKSLVPNNLQDRTIAQLTSFHLSFKEKYLRLIEERNAIPQTIHPAKMNFGRTKLEEVYLTFDKIGRFSFELTPKEPAYRFYSRVLVNQAEIEIETENPIDGWAWVFLRHNGNSTVIDQLGNFHKFSHRKRDRVSGLTPGTRKTTLSLGGDIETYAFLSPFTNWTFMMEFADGNGEILSGDDEKEARKNIRNVSIRFKGIADSRYGDFSDFASNYSDENGVDFEPPSIA